MQTMGARQCQTIYAVLRSDFPESWCQYAFILEIIAKGKFFKKYMIFVALKTRSD